MESIIFSPCFFPYGKISKRDPIAWDFALDISENALLVSYTYDSFDTRTYVGDDLKPKVELNKNYCEMESGKFSEKIGKYVVTPLRIVVKTEEKKKQKKTNLYASDDNFIGLCDLAKSIHASYNDHCMCREEHVRWVKEKLSMGWKYGTDYTTREERNRKKIHKDIVPYEMLTEDEQSKDELMVKNILGLLKKFCQR